MNAVYDVAKGEIKVKSRFFEKPFIIQVDSFDDVDCQCYDHEGLNIAFVKTIFAFTHIWETLYGYDIFDYGKKGSLQEGKVYFRNEHKVKQLKP